MFKTGTRAAYAVLATAVALLSPKPAGAAQEVCSAWAEPARIAQQIELRQRQRMRADPAWVLEVARNPQANFGYDNILMTPPERVEFQARFDEKWRASAQREPMLRQANAYAEQHPDEFAGSYVRSASNDFWDPPLACVLMFTGDLAAHRAALKNLPYADIPLEILPARYSLKKLEKVADALGSRYEAIKPGRDIRLFSYGPDIQRNVVLVEAESDASDAAARLTAGYGDIVRATIHPWIDDSKKVDVTQGKGWRLLGRASRLGNSDAGEGTRLATSELDWRGLREANNLTPPLQGVDFRKEVVLTFTASISCLHTYLDGIVIDQQLQSIEPAFSLSGSPRRQLCPAIYTGYEVFAVAVERAALPPNPVTVPTHRNMVSSHEVGSSGAADCPRGLVIPRQ